MSRMSPERSAALAEIIHAEMPGLPVEAHDAASGHPLCVVGFGPEEVLAATEVMLTTEVTMGARVRAFEAVWAARCEKRHGVMVNSGSSANLLLLAGLVETGHLAPGDEVLVPAVGWSTTLFPVAQVGLVPVLVDVDPTTLCLCPKSAAAARTDRTRAVFAVHLLGQAAEMAPYDDLLVLEDACGAHGATIGGRPVGAIGLGATFSFFFSHHITTMEGGIVVTDDDALADALRSLRAHGWTRERSDRKALEAASPEIDPRFLFVSPGYNLRPTEVAAAFGLVQDRRLDAWVARRRSNHADWCARLAAIPGLTVFPEAPGTTHAGFAFPMLVEGDRAGCMAALEARGIATRPVSGSNLARQPAFARVPSRTPVPLPVADAVHTRGFFVGNSHAFGPDHGARLAAALTSWSSS
ncbi:MAG: DegT/DnrJ/EryC1/StrS family aminotransferase [Pseudomonadota bacterium]|nr:DegT/DnrJ/EryC1/StrS family aminotransferase [Pseudomonadota bacterium]